MAGDLRIDQLGAQRLEPAERAFLVGLDQARIASDIGREDRREPTFDASLPCGLHGASSVAADPTRTGRRRALSKNPPSSLRQDQRVSCTAVWGTLPDCRCPFPGYFPLMAIFPGFAGPEIPGSD